MTTPNDGPDVAQQIADLNSYGQALNQCTSAEEVVSLTLEAMSLLFEFPHASFVEDRSGERRVADSTHPAIGPGDPAGEPSRRAVERRETVTVTGEPAAPGTDSSAVAALAVPAAVVDDVVAVLVTRSTTETAFDEADVRPLEILASHAATALGNIRSRERLERAHRDLEARTELVELYDRLLRHDLRNSLNVVTGYARTLAEDLDGEASEKATKMWRTADESIGLIRRVGDLLSSIETADELEPRSLDSVLERAVENALGQRESLTVEFDPPVSDYEVYGGDLLESVFVNLLTNAAEHNAGPVTVRIGVSTPESGSVVVSVADDGSGVDEAVRDDLFEMGVKRPGSDGTGLGLGFVRRLCESYGGGVDVGESDEGGAEFEVTLERA